MKNLSVLFVYMVVASVVSGCSMNEGISGFFQCLNDHTAEVSETDFNSERLCNKEYTCESVPTPENYEASDSNYYLCYRCEEGTLYCNNECIASNEAHCGACDHQCGINETCENYRCLQADNCISGTFKCDDSQLWECINGDWSQIETCDSGMICDAEAGKCVVCKPKTYHCDGAELQKCEQGSWKSQETCESAEQCDAGNGKCSCVKGSHRCDGPDLKVCRDGEWESELTCASEELCDADDGKCLNCIEDTYQCNGGMGGKLSQCQDKDWALAKSCLPTELCNAEKGLCLACDSDVYSCDGKALKHCSNGSWDLVQECGRGMKCDENVGKCIPDSDEDGTPDDEDYCPFNPEKSKKDVCGCNKDFPDETGGCGNTFHIYQANDLKKYKAFSNNKCAEFFHVILHGQINLIDYNVDKKYNSEGNVICSDSIDISDEGECSPLIFEGESLNEIEPEIIYEPKDHSDNSLCKVTSSLFETFKSEVEIINIKLSYSIKGEVNGALASSMNKARISNVHYQGEFNNTPKSKGDFGGIIGSCSGCTLSNVTFDCGDDGELYLDAVEGESNVGGICGKLDNNSWLNNVSFIGNITIKSGKSVNLGGIVGLFEGAEVNGQKSIIEDVHYDGSIIINESEIQPENTDPKFGIGGIAGTINNAQLWNVSLNDLSIDAQYHWNVGGVAGRLNDSTLENECNDIIKIKTIKGYQNIGGILGACFKSNVSRIRSVVDESVVGERVSGGFVGFSHNGSFNYIVNQIKYLSGSNYIGGFVGESLVGLTITNTQNLVDGISVQYKPHPDDKKDNKYRKYCGGFLGYGYTASGNEKSNITIQNVRNDVGKFKSDLETSKGGTGGFAGALSLNSGGLQNLFSQIISTVGNMESPSNVGGFVGNIYMAENNSAYFKTIFSWSNISINNTNGQKGGFFGGFSLNKNSYVSLNWIMSATKLILSGKTLNKYGFTSEDVSNLIWYLIFQGIDKWFNQFYLYDWTGEGNSPFSDKDYLKKYFTIINDSNVDSKFKAPENNDIGWSIQPVTVGDETRNMPIFDLPPVCEGRNN